MADYRLCPILLLAIYENALSGNLKRLHFRFIDIPPATEEKPGRNKKENRQNIYDGNNF
jgi:hypothetical protein